jgi:predicted transposase/invertase (TIGR01784 family)
MRRHSTHISFDWALKRLLRQKANFVILEGFLTELLKMDVQIEEMLESEGNQDFADQKFNKVDILCKNNSSELFLIELQFDYEYDYFQRMLYGTSKLITDFLKLGQKYEQVKKVYSINIVYFDLGQGEDYIYHGTTHFKGIHKGDVLNLNAKQRDLLQKEQIFEIFPEYYILKINNFNDIAKDSLDEWMYYFKNNALPETYKAKGLNNVDEQLHQDQMTEQERIDYEASRKSLMISRGVLDSALYDGKKLAEEELLPIIEEERRQKEEAIKKAAELEKLLEEMRKKLDDKTD